MKHLEVLRQANLVNTREEGRQRMNSLNAVPIRKIYERWVSPFREFWSDELLRIKDIAEKSSAKRGSERPRKQK
jgi:DNA-binding transcriptional ArsR family regulator